MEVLYILMEDLSKTQIILLGLLVSFVSSVAISIMTYSLLSEAPATITQTINRVVERTIETVVPAENKPEVITKEVTVVVKEEDLVIDAIKKNEGSLVRIQEIIKGVPPKFSAFGLVLHKGGLIATSKTNFLPNATFEAVLPDNSKVTLKKMFAPTKNFSFFTVENSAQKEFVGASMGDSDTLQLGQTVISIRGVERNTVSIGRINGLLLTPENSENATSSRYSLIESDVLNGEVGSPALNLNGELIGMSSGQLGNFIPINLLKLEMQNLI
ncbi:MAG: serine protease [Patescibacteria group bacterium]